MFYHVWCRTNAALMRTSKNSPLFSSKCTTWLIDVHPIWSEENILEVLHIVPLDLQSHYMQRHVRWHSNTFHTHIHQRPFYIMDACQNCVMMDAMARNPLGDQNALQCLVKMQAKCSMPILQRFRHWRAGCDISGLSPKLLPSSPVGPLLLDKVYLTFTITLNFEDDLGS